MADVLVSKVLEELISIVVREIEQEVRLIVGVKKEVQMLTTKFQLIKAVLVDAENRQVKEDAIKLWMQTLKNISYDMDDVLDEWTTAIQKSQIMGDERVSAENKRKVRCLICFSCFRCREVGVRRDIAVKIKDLNAELDIIVDQQRAFNFVSFQEETKQVERFTTTSFIDVAEVKGRDQEQKAIMKKLLTESSQTPSLHIISIVGMGGIGKTTLAKLVYNDDEVKTHFETRIWVCVSDPFDEIKIAKAILESLTNEAPNLHELQTILQNIRKSLEGKKFLLILDDVWEENSAKWVQLKDCLKCGSPGSRILVTTRKEIVASAIGCIEIHKIGQLSAEDSWFLFSQIAFFGWSSGEREPFEHIGKKIVSRCKGLPLAVKTLGSILVTKKSKSEWQTIMYSEVWELENAEVDIFPHLWLSYNDLSPPLRQCFSYCAIFPKDHLMEKRKLIELWMAHGYIKETTKKDMERIGEEYFQNLASRSFFQDINIVDDFYDISYTCKMHDIVHDFAQYIRRDECFSMEVSSSVESSKESVSNEARYSRMVLAGKGSLPGYFYDAKKLRGLIAQFEGGFVVTAVLSSFFNELTCLRSLDLSNCDIEEIPPTISQLIHLRQLDLSFNDHLKSLPETLCELYNLQTLDAHGN
ncbi:putative disease resistance protein RGA3 [Hevea brasiliensis]|uniref:putative disease resistance protein RGA3 n=1 Tax=Hevea brasiliensis TaxID=3981 RepID=UPI0025E8BFEE|nr:putative disease resistance protein RGA3 [Hevea brasiliensis]